MTNSTETQIRGWMQVFVYISSCLLWIPMLISFISGSILIVFKQIGERAINSPQMLPYQGSYNFGWHLGYGTIALVCILIFLIIFSIGAITILFRWYKSGNIKRMFQDIAQVGFPNNLDPS